MKSLKVWTAVTMITGLLCGVGLLFSMLALQDIYHGTESSLTMEWTMVRISTGLTLIFIVTGLFTMLKVYRQFHEKKE